ncbi:MAG: DUF86 domain-containing protein [Nitrospirota bacterium]
MVDRALIGRKIAEMETYLSQIREFSKISVSAYKKGWKTQRIVERTLQIMIELCIDIANHLISDKGMRLPTGYADTFKVLMESQVISKNLFKTMEKMAKFRNVVVHQYEKIDPAIVVSILHRDLDDFRKYKKAIIKLL